MTKNDENPKALDELFDLDRLRIGQNFADVVGVKKVLTTVPVGKPDRQSFVRVHPEEAYRLPVAILEVREDRPVNYLVAPELAVQLPGEVSATMLFTATTRQEIAFLWKVKLPGHGRQDRWAQSAMEAAQLAQRTWIRVVANMGLGAYEIYQATGDLPEPTWPDLSFRELLQIAFRDAFIDAPDHPVLRRLRGEL